MTQKKFALSLVLIILFMPAFTFAMNKIFFSKFSKLPQGIFKSDRPLFSSMHLTRNYSAKTSRYGFYLKHFQKRYTTNSIGLRIPEVNMNKDLILFSGDSTIFGAGINDEETVPYLTGKSFIDKFEVANAGIPGKAVPHNLLTLMNFIEIYKNQTTKIKYFINWIHGSDFEYERTLDDVNNRALKSNLSWKQELKVRFPFLAEVWWAMRMHGGLGGPALTTTRTLFLERINYDFKANDRASKKKFNEIYLARNEKYFNKMRDLCIKNNIILINIVHAGTYQDIISKDDQSEYLERILIRNNAKHIIKTKDIYWLKPETLPHIAKEDNDFAHFSKHGAKIIADYLISSIQAIEDNDMSHNN